MKNIQQRSYVSCKVWNIYYLALYTKSLLTTVKEKHYPKNFLVLQICSVQYGSH